MNIGFPDSFQDSYLVLSLSSSALPSWEVKSFSRLKDQDRLRHPAGTPGQLAQTPLGGAAVHRGEAVRMFRPLGLPSLLRLRRKRSLGEAAGNSGGTVCVNTFERPYQRGGRHI